SVTLQRQETLHLLRISSSASLQLSCPGMDQCARTAGARRITVLFYRKNQPKCQLYLVLLIEEAKRVLQLLNESGIFCKHELHLPSVSIVSNGSMITKNFITKTLLGEYQDILAISCDSFDEDINQTFGRAQGRKSHLDNLFKVRDWCQKYKVAFKINSVINIFNVDEDMRENITKLNPVRWKVFQCLLIDGENSLREAERFLISDQHFQVFLERHSSISCLVPEANQKMRDSYLILDEYVREERSILDVGVEEAIQFSGFDEKMFLKRGGKYVWSKADMRLEW
uniref:Radical S-adenosyl methionine domain containing 2 n=1 Tax=Oncorhynchus kisutch TaxID=8019 RepID=A0A8C7F465_ONCKI